MKGGTIRIIIIVVLALIGISIIFSWRKRKEEMNTQEILAERDETEAETEPTIIKEEKEITAEILQDGLRDMGILVTQEYYFTEVVDFSKEKSIWNIPIAFTESSYLVSYDGEIMAGVDFNKIQVNKDTDKKTVTITIPASEIQSVTIDPDTFTLHSEKSSVFNPLTLEDYNEGLVKLENNAEEKAIDRGVLDSADKNAETIITNFVTSLLGDSEYQIIINREES